MKRQSKLNLIKTLAVLFAILISAVMFIWIYLTSDIADIRFNNEPAKSLGGAFNVTCSSDSGETVIKTELPSRLETAKAGDEITITRALSADDFEGDCIAFYLQQSWANVYLDDELLWETDRAPELPFPMSAGSHWYILRLPENFDGKILRIEITSQFDKFAPILPEIFCGTKSSIIYMITHNARFSILMGVSTIVLGITCILLGLVLYRKKSDGRMILLGMLAVSISAWYLLESRVSQVLFGNIALFSFVLFACHYLIPLLITSLLLTYETFNKRKFTHVIFWLSFASFIIVQILQVTGVAYYIEMLFIMHIMLILNALNIIISYIQEKRSGKPIQDIYIYKAFGFFAVFAAFDIICLYLIPNFRIGNASEVGLLLFIGYIIYTVFREFYEIEIDIAKSEIYHELAVKDLMTGLANRTAFEQEMSALRNSDLTETVYFLFADVNNLKSINDTYGHVSGDDCLISTAHILAECFTEPSTCYRIGGDEFCVICRGITDKKIDALIEKLHSLVKVKDEKTIYPYSLACGYHIIDSDGVDECLKKADAIMYKDKSRYKNPR